MNTIEAAAYLERPRRTLEAWRYQGVGPPYIRAGIGMRAKVRYRLSDLDAWLDAQTVRPGPA
jgi:hypothetical protein